jgi:hypothetical protein
MKFFEIASEDKGFVKRRKYDWVYMFEGLGSIRLTVEQRFMTIMQIKLII